MAQDIFNPRLPEENPPSFLSYSKGYEADKSTAALVKGAGEFIEGAAKAGDQYFQMKTGEEVREKLEPIRDAFLGLEKPPVGLTNDSSAPNDLVRRSERLTSLTRAMEAGTVPKSHYWMLMDSEVRQIKAQYPGHKDEVDRHVSNLVGTNPANRAVALLFEEARAGKAETQYQKWEKHLIDIGGGAPLMARKNAGKPMTMEEIQGEVTVIQKDKAESEIRRQGIAEQKNNGELITQNAQMSAQRDLSLITDTAIRSAMTGTGTTYTSLSQTIANTREKPGPHSAQEQEAIKNQFANLRSQVATTLANERARTNEQGFSWNQVVKAGDMDAIVKGEMHKLDILEDALLNKNLGILQSNAAYNEAIKNQDVRSLLQHPTHSGIYRQIQAVKEIVGGQLALQEVFKSSEQLSAITKALRDDTILKSTAGEPGHTLKSDLEQKSKQKFFNQAEYNRAVVNDSVNILGNKDMPPQVIANKINFLFSEGDLLYHTGKDGKISPRFENPQDVYLKLAANPKVIENITKIKDTNPTEYNTYRNFVVSNFAPMMELNAQAARNVVLQSEFYDLSFDPTNLAFNITPKAGVSPSSSQRDMGAERSVRAINTTFAAIRPLIESEGGDPKAILGQMLDTLQIDTSQTSRGSPVGNLWEKAMNLARTTLGAEPSTGPESKEGSRPKDAASLLDFIGRFEGGKDGYGAVFGKGRMDIEKMSLEQVDTLQGAMRRQGSKSTAVGKYQFIQDTLRETAEKMGLDPKTTKFTKEVQDQMIMHRLKETRGFDKFMKGEMSHEQFAHNLSQEFASLPNPKTGESFYKGDGLNRALTSSDEVRKVLERLVPIKDSKFAGNKALAEPDDVLVDAPQGEPEIDNVVIKRKKDGQRFISKDRKWVPYNQ